MPAGPRALLALVDGEVYGAGSGVRRTAAVLAATGSTGVGYGNRCGGGGSRRGGNLGSKLVRAYVGLAVKIDEAFAGEPFGRRWPAEHPNNVKRFRLYVALHLEAHNLELRACRLWLWAHDIRPDDISHLVTDHTAEQANAAEAPPGYRIVGYAPGQTLLQRE